MGKSYKPAEISLQTLGGFDKRLVSRESGSCSSPQFASLAVSLVTLLLIQMENSRSIAIIDSGPAKGER